MYNRDITNNNALRITNMTKEEIKLAVAHMTKEQLIELVAELTISEQEKRKELDKIQGIIR
jgi:hypothetical protein